MVLLLSSPAIRLLLSLRPPGVYDSLQIFQNKAGHKSLVSWYVVQFSAELIEVVLLHLSCSSYLLLQSICHESQFHLHNCGSSMMHQCGFPEHYHSLIDARCGTILPDHACCLLLGL